MMTNITHWFSDKPVTGLDRANCIITSTGTSLILVPLPFWVVTVRGMFIGSHHIFAKSYGILQQYDRMLMNHCLDML